METQPYYRQIYASILKDISSGRLKPGDRVPSEKELCVKYSVSRITSKKALEMLSQQGMISRFPGKGSFVTGNDFTKQTGASRSIGFIIPDFGDSFGTKLIYGIEETCGSLGYRLVLKRTRDIVDQESDAIHTLMGTDISGILLLPIHGEYYNAEILKLILNRKPLVFVDRKMRGLAIPTVSTDNIAAAELGIEYLFRLGHRNIAFYSGPVSHTSTIEDRQNGFIRAFMNFGIHHDPALFCLNLTSIWRFPFYAHDRVALDVRLVREHLSVHPEVSAAFVTEYTMTAIVKTAAEELGRRIPEDLSILSFDAPATIVGVPPFTHLYQDEYSIGKQSVELLHRIINGTDPASLKDVLVPARLIIGTSTTSFEST
ncbi:MAG: GntR family transcriptional regulator [Spirochaetaceae bacterium]|nr:GntR family transcriptional regulator [Spirochaetaceae bacterium]